MNNKTITRTITSKDVNQSKKGTQQSLILGYKVKTVTMHADTQDASLTKGAFEAFLKKIARPLKKDER